MGLSYGFIFHLFLSYLKNLGLIFVALPLLLFCRPANLIKCWSVVLMYIPTVVIC